MLQRLLVCFGVPLRIETTTRALWDALPPLLPHATEEVSHLPQSTPCFSLLPPEGGCGFRCLQDDVLLLEHTEFAPVAAELARALMVHVADLAPNHVFVHAGVVGWRGRALILPGSSFAGKTSLTAALVRLGASYLSDEYAAIDPLGRVHPYARDLQVREDGEAEQTGVPVAALGGTAATSPLPVAQVVFARFRPGAVWDPRPLTAGLAILEMLRHTIPVQRTPARVLQTLAAMMHTATASTSERGEATECAAALLHSMPPFESPSMTQTAPPEAL